MTHRHPSSQPGGSSSEKNSQAWPSSQYLGGSTPGATLLWNCMASLTLLNWQWLQSYTSPFTTQTAPRFYLCAPRLRHISPETLEKARLFWIQATQATYFSHELKALQSDSPLAKAHAFNLLTAYIDAQGVIRVGGRLAHAALSFDTKHPAILPRHSHLSSLIIAHAHQRTLHGDTQLTLSHIRQQYWILGGRAPVKSHILRWPLTVKTWKGRGAKTSKGWICVFVCFSTSAVHLEAVSDYSTEGFIAAYRRFSSRRGIAHTLHSDCGTNFIGADTALKRLFIQSTQEHQRISHLLSQDNTRWEFNPPATPHMGGKWESVVKSIKYHLRRTIGENVLTFEELTTLLTQIEAILNSRPLEPLSDDPEDISTHTRSLPRRKSTHRHTRAITH
ncbi:PREDICTED: uncharacterized protein LOC105556798 [Vollenhovia emeryi]|uniref:uncharacterized protein LOC105556798 n=1 Tax=Vollenhovia emeryi TaxID=411798 RepID=UPI0005F431E5|nr:PREDICTED: uncharacterized protein LOC105556798 [Vollenhovia emeryi]